MNNMTYLKYLSSIIITFLLLGNTSCSDSPQTTLPRSKVSLILSYDENIDLNSVNNSSILFKNITNGKVYSFDKDEELCVIPGIYDISFSGEYKDVSGNIIHLKASKSSVEILGEYYILELAPFIEPVGDDFVIAEIFFTGTLRKSGNQYYGDDYIKIYNNTEHTLYADGLTIFESKFNTTDKYNYTPDIMDSAMSVQALYTIPGSGSDFPVRPGEYILIADTGIDHRVINPNSFDLSHADWEWYDISQVPSQLDIDSPSVPNLDKWYCYTRSFWMLHNRGFKAYGLARIPVSRDEYLNDFRYSYDYEIVVEAGTFPMSDQAYQLPNEWIVDVVNCSVEAKYAWTLCHPSLDSGWTFCGTIDHDKTRYFHSVRRKLAGFSEYGYPILQDTNNSSTDFNPFCVPSEIELQGSAMDINGTPCTIITWDGVIPRTEDK